MNLYSKDDILNHAKELAAMIAKTNEVEFFKKAEAKINENERIQHIIKQVKNLQKQSVNLQHLDKEKAQADTDSKIEELLSELDAYPIVKEFQQSQVEVNDILQLVSVTIANGVTDEIIRSTGGDVLKGQTGSKVKNKK
ncbi:MAG: hypothetical protein K0S34_1816 [Bacillales bacterium]|jgi:cell fate (sporulation/competence/biofilm development) regulator YmcA (YheA/YmcA/DUF963 family)|nr:hypothetical protein [Bacillales bacterium]